MKTIGRYEILGLLGKGGMGKVYRVVLPAIGKIAALKLLAPDPLLAKLMGADNLRSLFIGEARIMAGLHHPNIVGVHDFEEVNGRLFYTMDYHANNIGVMIGENFRPDQPSRLIGIDRALDYTRQTLQGLARLHDAGIVHRDIKPYNLLLTDWDVVKICDFGLSKLHGETFAGPSNLNVGSPFYAAPEQERSPDDVDPRADLYSVGVMLYRMLAGSLPRTQETRGRMIPLKTFRPEMDEPWDAFINQALAADPVNRFEHVGAMLTALKELENHWQNQKESICLSPPADQRAQAVCPKRSLRRDPLKLKPEKARISLGLDDLWRPGRYTRNHFEKHAGGVVHDKATGLFWQQGGTTFPCDWKQARRYVRTLNQDMAGGRRTWRMPTIEELASLLRPAHQIGDLCIASVFDPAQRQLWSCDKRSFTAAYYADIELGFIGWHDTSAPCHLRAVSS